MSDRAGLGATTKEVTPQVLGATDLSELLSRQKAWLDPDFPPMPSSLAHDWDIFNHGDEQKGLQWTEIEWKRPSEIKKSSDWVADPQVYIGGVDPDDVQQGLLGDCYFLSALSVLAEQDGLIERLILTPNVTPSGVFAARFCKHGEYCDVVVDDHFPCVLQRDDEDTGDGQAHGDEDKRDRALKAALEIDGAAAEQHWAAAFSQAADGELWPAILEKCWAKLHGSYQAIESGDPGQTLRDLTGAPSDFCPSSNPSQLWTVLLESYHKGFLLCAGMQMDTNVEFLRADGLVEGHAYAVRRVVDVDGERLIQLRNPWGKTEWAGDYGDSSGKWTEELKKELDFKSANDGTFWMALPDFAAHFDGVHVNRCRSDWVYRYVKPASPPVLPDYGTSEALFFQAIVPPVSNKKTDYLACLTLSQRDRRVLGDECDSTSEYASASLQCVRVDAASSVDGRNTLTEASVVIGVSKLIQGRETCLEAKLVPGTYIVAAHIRREADAARPDPPKSDVPVVFSCYSAAACILSAIPADAAWSSLAQVYRVLTDRTGTSDDVMYRQSHCIGETHGDANLADNGLSLRVWQCRQLRLFCMLHRNTGGKTPVLLCEEICFSLENMEIFSTDESVEIDHASSSCVVTLSPGESTFLMVRPRSLGKYSLNFSRECQFEPL